MINMSYLDRIVMEIHSAYYLHYIVGLNDLFFTFYSGKQYFVILALTHSAFLN